MSDSDPFQVQMILLSLTRPLRITWMTRLSSSERGPDLMIDLPDPVPEDHLILALGPYLPFSLYFPFPVERDCIFDELVRLVVFTAFTDVLSDSCSDFELIYSIFPWFFLLLLFHFCTIISLHGWLVYCEEFTGTCYCIDIPYV